jgi:hypothetical protein
MDSPRLPFSYQKEELPYCYCGEHGGQESHAPVLRAPHEKSRPTSGQEARKNGNHENQTHSLLISATNRVANKMRKHTPDKRFISKDHQIKGADIIGKSMKDIHRLLNYNSRSRNDKFRRNKNSHYQRNNYGYRRNNNKVYRDKNGFIRDNRNYKRKYTP